MEPTAAVLVSGAGSNLQALLDDASVAPHLGLVLSDRPDAGALERARDRGVPTIVLEPAAFPDRASFTDAVRDALRERGVGVVVMAGFMRVLSPSFFEAFPNRVLNVHPALLPAFPGAHGVRDALDWGVKVTGVTVHLVDDQVDHGPIVSQEAVAVHEDDDRDSLEVRIHEAEHRLLPGAVRALLEGRLVVRGRHVLIEGEP
jgi:phosphoribosylglycinamide formyltransferase-1